MKFGTGCQGGLVHRFGHKVAFHDDTETCWEEGSNKSSYTKKIQVFYQFLWTYKWLSDPDGSNDQSFAKSFAQSSPIIWNLARVQASSDWHWSLGSIVQVRRSQERHSGLKVGGLVVKGCAKAAKWCQLLSEPALTSLTLGCNRRLHRLPTPRKASLGTSWHLTMSERQPQQVANSRNMQSAWGNLAALGTWSSPSLKEDSFRAVSVCDKASPAFLISWNRFIGTLSLPNTGENGSLMVGQPMKRQRKVYNHQTQEFRFLAPNLQKVNHSRPRQLSILGTISLASHHLWWSRNWGRSNGWLELNPGEGHLTFFNDFWLTSPKFRTQFIKFDRLSCWCSSTRTLDCFGQLPEGVIMLTPELTPCILQKWLAPPYWTQGFAYAP